MKKKRSKKELERLKKEYLWSTLVSCFFAGLILCLAIKDGYFSFYKNVFLTASFVWLFASALYAIRFDLELMGFEKDSFQAGLFERIRGLPRRRFVSLVIAIGLLMVFLLGGSFVCGMLLMK